MPEVGTTANTGSLESVGSVPERGTDARTYEQITSDLKSGKTDVGIQEPEPDTQTAEAPETDQPTQPTTQDAEEELRTMTDAEIAALSPELQKEAKALRKRFQAAYTKKTMDLAEIRRKAEIVDRFDSDPTFQDQVIRQIQSSRQPTRQSATQQPSTPSHTGPPAALVEMARQSLPPEMQWMAEAQAKFGWQIVQAVQANMIQPLQQNLSQVQQQRQEKEYLDVLNDFSGRNPGWEEKEDDMVDVLEFIKSPALTSPRWGSKHDLLYRLAQGTELEANAVQKTIERTAQAVKSRSVVSSGAGRGTASNIEDRIRDRKISNDTAWDLIKQKVGSGR
jgi:ribosomal protein L29